MILAAVTSVTFRALEADAIIGLARQARLDAIEWGGDVHVPPGDTPRATAIRERTISAGLEVCSYGSYYRCTDGGSGASRWVETARALGAPVMRVWAGCVGSAEAAPEDRDTVVRSLRATLAAACGIGVALEYHAGTLTDTLESAHRLLDEVGDNRLGLYWQPRNGGAFDEDFAELKAAAPHLAHLHVFHWMQGPNGLERRPLEEGAASWQHFLSFARELPGDRAAILEFVRGDEPSAFLADAATLRRWLDRP